jgi:hypothetical protein
MGFKWVVPPTSVFPQAYAKYTQAVFTSGRRVAEARAGDMERWAKNNAPWTDRTGNARSSLHADVADSPGVVAEITLSHGVEYGIWLEIAHAGRFAIIAPAIDTYGPIFMRDMQNMMNLGLVTRGEVAPE